MDDLQTESLHDSLDHQGANQDQGLEQEQPTPCRNQNQDQDRDHVLSKSSGDLRLGVSGAFYFSHIKLLLQKRSDSIIYTVQTHQRMLLAVRLPLQVRRRTGQVTSTASVASRHVKQKKSFPVVHKSADVLQCSR